MICYYSDQFKHDTHLGNHLGIGIFMLFMVFMQSSVGLQYFNSIAVSSLSKCWSSQQSLSGTDHSCLPHTIFWRAR